MSGESYDEFSSTSRDMPPLTEEESEEEHPMPEGVAYSLNLKRLVTQQFQRLARMPDLPATTSASSTLQLLEGKLLEMDHESKNAQVIVFNNSGRLFLVSNSGVISAEPELVSVGDAINELSHMITSEVNTHKLESLRKYSHK